MANKLQRFTQRARRVLAIAKGEADRLHRALDAINEVLSSGDLARIYQLGQYAAFVQWRSRQGRESQ